MEAKVPIRNSAWSGTGTVIVEPGTAFCMTMWLPLRRTSKKPCPARILHASRP